MIQMVLTEDQHRFLAEAQEPVEIVDRRGRKLTRVQPSYSDAEAAELFRKARESGLGGSPRETIERLKLTHPIPMH